MPLTVRKASSAASAENGYIASLGAAVLHGLEALQAGVPVGQVAAQLTAADLVTLINVLSEHQLVVPGAARLLHSAAADAGAAEAKRIGSPFDPLDPKLAAWISRYTGQLITDITHDVRLVVASTITRVFRDGLPTLEAAKLIRDTVGLTGRFATAVVNYRARLVARGVPPAEVERATTAYARKLLAYRAQMIARTEVLAAANQGRWQAWMSGVANGIYDPTRAYKRWVAHVDSRTCSECIDLNDSEVPLLSPFANGEQMPPAHPQCRCSAVVLPDRASAELADHLLEQLGIPTLKIRKAAAAGAGRHLITRSFPAARVAKDSPFDPTKHPHGVHGHWAGTGGLAAIIAGVQAEIADIEAHPDADSPSEAKALADLKAYLASLLFEQANLAHPDDDHGHDEHLHHEDHEPTPPAPKVAAAPKLTHPDEAAMAEHLVHAHGVKYKGGTYKTMKAIHAKHHAKHHFVGAPHGEDHAEPDLPDADIAGFDMPEPLQGADAYDLEGLKAHMHGDHGQPFGAFNDKPLVDVHEGWHAAGLMSHPHEHASMGTPAPKFGIGDHVKVIEPGDVMHGQVGEVTDIDADGDLSLSIGGVEGIYAPGMLEPVSSGAAPAVPSYELGDIVMVLPSVLSDPDEGWSAEALAQMSGPGTVTSLLGPSFVEVTWPTKDDEGQDWHSFYSSQIQHAPPGAFPAAPAVVEPPKLTKVSLAVPQYHPVPKGKDELLADLHDLDAVSEDFDGSKISVKDLKALHEEWHAEHPDAAHHHTKKWAGFTHPKYGAYEPGNVYYVSGSKNGYLGLVYVKALTGDGPVMVDSKGAEHVLATNVGVKKYALPVLGIGDEVKIKGTGELGTVAEVLGHNVYLVGHDGLSTEHHVTELHKGYKPGQGGPSYTPTNLGSPTGFVWSKEPPFTTDSLVVAPFQISEGMHDKTVYTAPDGTHWLFKPEPAWHAQGEVAVYELRNRLGLESTQAYAVTVKGETGSLQRLLTNDPKHPWKTAQEMIARAEKEHDLRDVLERWVIFDWLVGNHDANPNQIIETPGGVAEIDFGQAFKFFDRDTIDPKGWKNPNPEAELWGELYDAFAGDQIDLKWPELGANDPVSQLVARIEALPDGQYREMLRPYAEGAAKAGVLAYGDVGKFLDAAVARKQSIRADLIAHLDKLLALRKGLPNWSSGDKADAWGMKHYGPAWSKLGAEEKHAIRSYQQGSESYINLALRGGTPWSSGYRARAELMDAALTKHGVPNDTLVWRGIDVHDLTRDLQRNGLAPGDVASLVGKTIRDDGYMCTSLYDKPVWHGNVFLRITVEKGTPGFYSKASGSYGSEFEMTLGRHQDLHVYKVTTDAKGKWIIHVRTGPADHPHLGESLDRYIPGQKGEQVPLTPEEKAAQHAQEIAAKEAAEAASAKLKEAAAASAAQMLAQHNLDAQLFASKLGISPATLAQYGSLADLKHSLHLTATQMLQALGIDTSKLTPEARWKLLTLLWEAARQANKVG